MSMGVSWRNIAITLTDPVPAAPLYNPRMLARKKIDLEKVMASLSKL
jgi:hypothetical protein